MLQFDSTLSVSFKLQHDSGPAAGTSPSSPDTIPPSLSIECTKGYAQSGAWTLFLIIYFPAGFLPLRPVLPLIYYFQPAETEVVFHTHPSTVTQSLGIEAFRFREHCFLMRCPIVICFKNNGWIPQRNSSDHPREIKENNKRDVLDIALLRNPLDTHSAPTLESVLFTLCFLPLILASQVSVVRSILWLKMAFCRK